MLLIVVPAVVPTAKAGVAKPIVAVATISGRTCVSRTFKIVQFCSPSISNPQIRFWWMAYATNWAKIWLKRGAFFGVMNSLVHKWRKCVCRPDFQAFWEMNRLQMLAVLEGVDADLAVNLWRQWGVASSSRVVVSHFGNPRRSLDSVLQLVRHLLTNQKLCNIRCIKYFVENKGKGRTYVEE